MRYAQNQRGIALPMAIFALVVIGGLVAGAFFVATQEQTVGRNTVKLQQAFAAAEAGVQLQVANWSSTANNALDVGDSITFSGTVTSGPGWYRGSIRKLSDLLFLVRAEGFNRDSTTRQQVGMIVRLRPIEVNINSALKTQGATKIGGSSFISGNDHLPGTWTDCPALASSLPGIRLDTGGSISTSGCGSLSCVEGSPKVQVDSTINDSTLTNFGDVSFDELKDLSTIQVAGGNYKIDPQSSGTTCLTGVLTNWGSPLDPTGACGNYFPIIWVEGDISINGNSGQGVLVVNGSLSVQGGFEFYGPVIVRHSLKTTGTGGHFNGGVIAANVDLDQNTVLGDAVVNYSSCALLKALTASASGDLLRERSWINLY